MTVINCYVIAIFRCIRTLFNIKQLSVIMRTWNNAGNTVNVLTWLNLPATKSPSQYSHQKVRVFICVSLVIFINLFLTDIKQNINIPNSKVVVLTNNDFVISFLKVSRKYNIYFNLKMSIILRKFPFDTSDVNVKI